MLVEDTGLEPATILILYALTNSLIFSVLYFYLFPFFYSVMRHKCAVLCQVFENKNSSISITCQFE